MTMPAQKPGRSEQSVQTPPELIEAVLQRPEVYQLLFALDVAADSSNAKAAPHYTEADNGLMQSWKSPGWAWCNPPYGDIAPWVAKASTEGAKVAVLVPASVGANWWRDHVDGKCLALLLNGRITFVGHTSPYPKDCAVLLYGPGVATGYEVWTWGQGRAAGRRELRNRRPTTRSGTQRNHVGGPAV